MDLNDKINKLDDDLDLINESIDRLLNEQWQNLVKWFARKKVKDVIFGDDDDIDDDSIDDVEKTKKIKDTYEKWRSSKDKDKDLEDAVEDVKDVLGVEGDDDVVEEFRKMLKDIAEKQNQILKDALNMKSFKSVEVDFRKPIDFQLKSGSKKGEKLTLQNKMTFEVFSMEKKSGKDKIYFIYKTRYENWLKDYSIMFSMRIKDPQSNKVYDGIGINIVYLNENSLRMNDISIVDEKILTNRAIVEIKSIK